MHNFFKGPKIPRKLDGAESVEIDGSWIVIGGHDGSAFSSDIYKISCFSNSCEWNKMDQELQVARMHFVVIPAPYNLCTN